MEKAENSVAGGRSLSRAELAQQAPEVRLHVLREGLLPFARSVPDVQQLQRRSVRPLPPAGLARARVRVRSRLQQHPRSLDASIRDGEMEGRPAGMVAL